MTAFAAAIDILFTDVNMSVAAVWQADGVGPGVPVRVIRQSPDDVQEFGQARISQPTTVLDVRASEVAAPKAGDRVVIGSEAYLVQGVPQRDRDRLIWSVDTRPAP
jgi:hypothetical protein